MTTRAERIALAEGSYNSFEFFANNCLRLIDLDRRISPFKLNPLQRKVHTLLEKQKRETGRVRAIICKYRRGGCSTYIAGRFYRYASLMPAQSVGIVAHVSKSTGALYSIVKRFHQYNPIAPSLSSSNIREMVFGKLDSRYSVFSAETLAAGRGEDVNLLHLSELAYYPDAKSIMSGLVEAVPDRPGTEIIIESTAKGPFGEFYEMCQESMRGNSKYQFIFVPWSIDPELADPVPPGFEPSAHRIDDAFMSERELMELGGLTAEQIVWRRNKMNGDRNLYSFVKEFPLTVEEAFSAQSERALINPTDVIRARKASVPAAGPTLIGVDPAGMGGDRFAIACRQGACIKWVRSRTKVTFNEGVAWIRDVIETEAPDKVFIDAGGGGGGSAICSSLSDDPKISRLIRPVNFGGRSQAKLARPDKPGPINRRAEMWGRLADWLSGDAQVSLPDDEDLPKDLAMARVRELNGGDWRLESKDKDKSPDLADAVALCFAEKYLVKSQNADIRDADVRFDIRGPVGSKRLSWMA